MSLSSPDPLPTKTTKAGIAPSPRCNDISNNLTEKKEPLPLLYLTFRTSALDYPRISFGAKLRGAVRYRALISPPARCGNRTAVAMAALPTQRGSHAVIHMVGQRHGPDLVPGGPRDQPDNSPSWNWFQLNSIAPPAWSRSALRRGIPGSTPESAFLHASLLCGKPAGRVKRHRHWSCPAAAGAGVGAGSTRS